MISCKLIIYNTTNNNNNWIRTRAYLKCSKEINGEWEGKPCQMVGPCWRCFGPQRPPQVGNSVCAKGKLGNPNTQIPKTAIYTWISLSGCFSFLAFHSTPYLTPHNNCGGALIIAPQEIIIYIYPPDSSWNYKALPSGSALSLVDQTDQDSSWETKTTTTTTPVIIIYYLLFNVKFH